MNEDFTSSQAVVLSKKLVSIASFDCNKRDDLYKSEYLLLITTYKLYEIYFLNNIELSTAV